MSLLWEETGVAKDDSPRFLAKHRLILIHININENRVQDLRNNKMLYHHESAADTPVNMKANTEKRREQYLTGELLHYVIHLKKKIFSTIIRGNDLIHACLAEAFPSISFPAILCVFFGCMLIDFVITC